MKTLNADRNRKLVVAAADHLFLFLKIITKFILLFTSTITNVSLLLINNYLILWFFEIFFSIFFSSPRTTILLFLCLNLFLLTLDPNLIFFFFPFLFTTGTMLLYSYLSVRSWTGCNEQSLCCFIPIQKDFLIFFFNFFSILLLFLLLFFIYYYFIYYLFFLLLLFFHIVWYRY